MRFPSTSFLPHYLLLANGSILIYLSVNLKLMEITNVTNTTVQSSHVEAILVYFNAGF
jgi:hypothetical protein